MVDIAYKRRGNQNEFISSNHSTEKCSCRISIPSKDEIFTRFTCRLNHNLNSLIEFWGSFHEGEQQEGGVQCRCTVVKVNMSGGQPFSSV